MMQIKLALVVSALMFGNVVHAGVVNPDCTAEKAAKSAATKATVGVGGRCSPAEAAKDSTKKAVGVEEKGVVEKKLKK